MLHIKYGNKKDIGGRRMRLTDAIEEKRTQFKRYIEEVTKREKLEQELAETKGE